MKQETYGNDAVERAAEFWKANREHIHAGCRYWANRKTSRRASRDSRTDEKAAGYLARAWVVCLRLAKAGKLGERVGARVYDATGVAFLAANRSQPKRDFGEASRQGKRAGDPMDCGRCASLDATFESSDGGRLATLGDTLADPSALDPSEAARVRIDYPQLLTDAVERRALPVLALELFTWLASNPEAPRKLIPGGRGSATASAIRWAEARNVSRAHARRLRLALGAVLAQYRTG